jgi:hypothetical protein
VVTTNAPASVDLNGCSVQNTYNVRISDVNNNYMPAGTTVVFAASGDGALVGTTSFVVPNTSAKIATGIGNSNYHVTIKSDGTYTAAAGATPASCSDTTSNGALTVTTKTPSGITTTVTLANVIN